MMITAIPEAKVNLKSSLIGAFFGTILWGLARGAFTEGASYVIRMSKLYGSIAVIPIFLFWLYLIWIIIFLALEISYVHQHYKQMENRDYEKNQTPLQNVELGFSIFMMIAEHFDTGKSYTSVSEISKSLLIAEDSVNNFINNLSSSDLIYIPNESSGKIFPSRSLNKILTKDVLISIMGTETSTEIDDSVSKIIKDFFTPGYEKIGASTIEDYLNQK